MYTHHKTSDGGGAGEAFLWEHRYENTHPISISRYQDGFPEVMFNERERALQ